MFFNYIENTNYTAVFIPYQRYNKYIYRPIYEPNFTNFTNILKLNLIIIFLFF